MTLQIDIPHERVTEFCQRHRIRRMALFGSVIRDDFTPESDVDVLVEFVAGPTPGLAFYSSLPDELSEILGRQVDLNTPSSLSRYFRQEVLDEAQEVYVTP
jgi:predicted nucleotidyltransferase